ncbi:MAG TPA: four helix bundle protein [Chitinophagaceae bacterium]|jgi:four helix bundle protein|nr:four helix bundle protein [Chitinophagaceae bacterium]
MATIQRFEDLEIWQLAFAIYKKVSAITERMRQKHDYRFADQMKAAAGSVMDNIAEGFERNSRLEFLNSLSISKGECGELKSQTHRCLSDQYISPEEFGGLYEEISILVRKISNFIIYLNKTKVRGLKFKDRSKL